MNITPVKKKPFGAVVTDIELSDLNDEIFSLIQAALLKYGFLLFPTQFLSDQEPGGIGGRRSSLHARRLTGRPATPAAQRRPDEAGPPHGTSGAVAAR